MSDRNLQFPHWVSLQSFMPNATVIQHAEKAPFILEILAYKFSVLQARGFVQVKPEKVQNLQVVRTRVDRQLKASTLRHSELVSVRLYVSRTVTRVLSGARGTVCK